MSIKVHKWVFVCLCLAVCLTWKKRFRITSKVHAHNLKPLECMFTGHGLAGSYLCLCMNMYALVCCVVCVCVLQGWQWCMKCEVDSMLFVLSLTGVGTCDPAVIQMNEFVMDTHRGYTCMAFSKIPTERCTLHCLFNACALYWVIPQRRREREKECRSQFELLSNDSVLVALNRFYWFWVETE